MANGNGFQFKMSIKDIVWTTILVISLIIAYTKFDTTVAAHVDNKNIHLQRTDIEKIQKLSDKIDHLEQRINELIKEVKKTNGG